MANEAFATRLVYSFERHGWIGFCNGSGCVEVTSCEAEPTCASLLWSPGTGSMARAASISRNVVTRLMGDSLKESQCRDAREQARLEHIRQAGTQ
jgi:dienelactone hydrolase